MSGEDEALVREAYAAYGQGDTAKMMARQAGPGLVSVIEEIASGGDKVMVVVHTPGVDQRRARPADDRNYLVLTLRQRQIIAMRACRTRAEAADLAGVG
jgi:hypothetical protein